MYHMVKGEEESYPRVVYCDTEKLPGNTGFQQSFGSPGNLREFVAFDAFLIEPVKDNFRYIGFSGTVINIGEAFIVEDRIFQVPVTGTWSLPMAYHRAGKLATCYLQYYNQ